MASPAPRKRPATSISSGVKRARVKGGRGVAISVGASRHATVDEGGRRRSTSKSSSSGSSDLDQLKEEFLNLFTDPNFQDAEMQGFSGNNSSSAQSISNAALKRHFGDEKYLKLAPVINELMSQSRLSMGKMPHNGELCYTLVSELMVAKMSGLDTSARLVYQVIERAGNRGIWTKDVRTQTNMQQVALTKVFKLLESRRLIKPVKSVAARAKKIYMLYDLTPAKELTGGPWYTEMEFDHEFISELRTFVLLCSRKIRNGTGVTLTDIVEKMKLARVSKVALNREEVHQLVTTLVYDMKLEELPPPPSSMSGEPLYVPSRSVTVPCQFKWWDVLANDFHFRSIVFEDGVTLQAHEPHYHTAS